MDLNMALIKADILMAKQGIELYEQNEVREVKNMVAYHLPTIWLVDFVM